MIFLNNNNLYIYLNNKINALKQKKYIIKKYYSINTHILKTLIVDRPEHISMLAVQPWKCTLIEFNTLVITCSTI